MGWLRGLFFFEAIVVFLVFGTRKEYIYQNQRGDETFKVYYNKVPLIIFTLGMIFISAYRISFIDTNDYRYMYKLIGRNLGNVFNNSVPRVEKGYLFFTYILNLVNTNSQFLIIITSLIIIISAVLFLYEQSPSVAFSFWIYFCLDFINSMNGVRQIMAAAIIMLIWMKWSRSEHTTGNDAAFICGILLMATIHKSALICIPIFFFARGPVFNWRIKGCLIIALLMFALPGVYYMILEGIFGGSTYSGYANESASMGMVRFLVKCIPMLLLLVDHFCNSNYEEQEERMIWIINISIFNFCCSLLALRMVYFARISMYFNIFDYVLIPWMIDRIFNGRSARAIRIVAVLMYGYFYFAQLNAFGGYVTGFDLVI